MKYPSVALYYQCVAIEENEVPKLSARCYRCTAIEENDVPEVSDSATSVLPQKRIKYLKCLHSATNVLP